MFNNKLIIIRGGGDIASGIALRLFNSGFKIIILETEKPSVIRRKVSFAEAVYEGETQVEGVLGRFADSIEDAFLMTNNNIIPVLIDLDLQYVRECNPLALVDSILAKNNTGIKIGMANIVIGVGPGFDAGFDVDAVIETKRGHYLGRVIYNGCAAINTGIPGDIGGYTYERVIRAATDGKIEVLSDIGTFVEAEDTIARIGNVEIKSKIKGVVRGMIKNDYYVTRNMKIGDVDPRANIDYCYTVSDKARAVGGGVLEAIMRLTSKF